MRSIQRSHNLSNIVVILYRVWFPIKFHFIYNNISSLLDLLVDIHIQQSSFNKNPSHSELSV